MTDQYTLFELLEAISYRLGNDPPAEWDPKTTMAAGTVSATLAVRVRQIEAQQSLPNAAPCAHPRCPLMVTLIGALPHHVDWTGKLHDPLLDLPVRSDDGSYRWERHEASPADRLRRQQLREIVANSVPCAHLLCGHNVAAVNGRTEHINSDGKLLGRVIDLPVPISDHSYRWETHEANPYLFPDARGAEKR